MLTIGAIARRVGVRNSAVRYYEARGLLKPAARLPNGYRIYDEGAINLLNFVRRAQALGITLKEIRKLLELSRRGQRPCAEVKQLAHQHFADLDFKIRQLELLRKELQSLLRRRSRQSRHNTICPLIEQERDRTNVQRKGSIFVVGTHQHALSVIQEFMAREYVGCPPTGLSRTAHSPPAANIPFVYETVR